MDEQTERAVLRSYIANHLPWPAQPERMAEVADRMRLHVQELDVPVEATGIESVMARIAALDHVVEHGDRSTSVLVQAGWLSMNRAIVTVTPPSAPATPTSIHLRAVALEGKISERTAEGALRQISELISPAHNAPSQQPDSTVSHADPMPRGATPDDEPPMNVVERLTPRRWGRVSREVTGLDDVVTVRQWLSEISDGRGADILVHRPWGTIALVKSGRRLTVVLSDGAQAWAAHPPGYSRDLILAEIQSIILDSTHSAARPNWPDWAALT